MTGPPTPWTSDGIGTHDETLAALKVVYGALFFGGDQERRLLPLVAFLQGEIADLREEDMA